MFFGVVDVACGDAQEVTTQLELLTQIPDCNHWARRVATFAVDGASNLGVRGVAAQQSVDVSTIANNMVALFGICLVLTTPLGKQCHMIVATAFSTIHRREAWCPSAKVKEQSRRMRSTMAQMEVHICNQMQFQPNMTEWLPPHQSLAHQCPSPSP